MMKNITLAFAIISLIACEINNENKDQLLNTIGENLGNEILSEQNVLGERIANIKQFPSSLIGQPQLKKLTTLDSTIQLAIDKVKKFTKVDYEVNSGELNKLDDDLNLSSDLIGELLEEFNESSAVAYGRIKLDVRLKNHFNFTAPELNPSEQKVVLLNEMLRLTKLTNEFIDIVIYAMTGDGMVVKEIIPVVAVLPQDLNNNENIIASVMLTAVNKNMSPQFYVGEIDNNKVDDSKPFAWSKGGEFKSPPLKKGFVKLKSIEGIGKTSLNHKGNISGVIEMLKKRGPVYLPFTSKGQPN